MRASLVVQPDASSTNLYEFLVDALARTEFDHVTAITAWTNYRGLARVIPTLRAFRARRPRGFAEIVLGIDEGGATAQGLRLAAAEFDDSWVFSTSDDRTFHPKLYLARGPREARLLVGSNNLTPGGLFFNFESAVEFEIKLDSSDPDGEAMLASVLDYRARLLGDHTVCKDLKTNLENIIRDPRYRVRDETAARVGARGAVADPDADAIRPSEPLFGRSAIVAKPRVPPGPPLVPAATRSPGASAGGGRRGATAPVVGRLSGAATRRWFRNLDRTAAQRPPNPASSPTGNIRLNQAGHGIDQTRFFRHDLFGRLVWTATRVPRGVRESASASMEVVVDGVSRGTMTFEISHASWREAGQGNVTTVLHVGPLAAEFRATDYSDRVLTIEDLPGSGYRMSIDVTSTGPFVP